ncbi:hypothetical protein N8467_00430 [bacterium]|jgi:hypothetical protein|nr:hypothetical protein [bacterium]
MKTYVIDIDGTICTKNCELEGSDYVDSQPIYDRINRINKLYDEGHTIIYMTARGMGRHKNNQLLAIQDFYTFTMEQIKGWGCKFHHLFLGKPAADHYIDDKGINDEDFFNTRD